MGDRRAGSVAIFPGADKAAAEVAQMAVAGWPRGHFHRIPRDLDVVLCRHQAGNALTTTKTAARLSNQ
jgi:hypothetical protein